MQKKTSFLLCLLLSCGLNDRSLLLQWHKAMGKCFAGAVIYVTSCSSSLSGEENHPEEQWLSLRQQLTWIYEVVADIINLFSFPKAGSEASLWEQTFFTLKQNKSCFLGGSTRREPKSWVLCCFSCGKLIYLLVEQDLLRMLRALFHLAGITVYLKPLEIAF